MNAKKTRRIGRNRRGLSEKETTFISEQIHRLSDEKAKIFFKMKIANIF